MAAGTPPPPPPTEDLHPASAGLHALGTQDLVRALHAADREVLPAVERALDDLARVADLVVAAWRAGGALLYVGAGTSGRLGALDAVECPPTFGVSPDLVRFVLAGGEAALSGAVERAEDDPLAGERAVADASRPGDVVVGIAASGRTPFVLGALRAARAGGRRTALVTASPDAPAELADVVVRLAVGPEIVAGSTRLKAGTATKLALNLVSTAAMVRTGRVWRGRMVDVAPGCAKLEARALRIVTELGGCDPEAARALLEAAGWRAKAAVVMARRGLSAEAARRLLDESGGFLGVALGEEAAPP